MKPFRERRLLQAVIAVYAVVWIVAAIRPHDRGDWLLENLLVLVTVPALVWSYRKRPLSDRAYVLLGIFYCLHAAGAHYTYSEVPVGDWIKQALGLERNHFDRIVHFGFGLLLTRPVAELLELRRLRPVWAAALPAAVIAAASGGYELVEMIVAWLVAPELGQAYLGTQGDVWDAQKDMAVALLGAALAASVLAVERRRRSRRRAQRRATTAAASLATALFAVTLGCDATVHRRDWSSYAGPGAEHFRKEELPFPYVEDPIEPYNRVTSALNHGLARYLFEPLAFFYRRILPSPVRTAITNASVNLQYPRRALNNLLQAKWRGLRVETTRFAINMTAGVLGLFDPATKWGWLARDEDFGQTLAHWGWDESTYVELPLFGRSTVRDGIGLVPDTYTDLAVLDWRVSVAREAHVRSDEIDDDLRFVAARYDAYEPARLVYDVERKVDVSDFTWDRDETSPSQSLDMLFLAPHDPDFADFTWTGRVRLAPDRVLPYTARLQRRRAPIVFLVPGLAGHRLSDSALALAELFFEEGNSVVVVSNPTNWEFIANGATVDLPGYVPADALDLHRAVTAIERRLEDRSPGRFSSRRLAGISMGAMQVLRIAASEATFAAQGLLAFDVYLAMDPPVSLEHAMTQLDRFYNAPLAFPMEERADRIDEILGKVIYLSRDLRPGMELPFTRLEAEFLIGLAYRSDLQLTILQTQDRHDQGVLKTPRSWLRRAPAFREISEYSFLEYFYAFVLPWYAARDPRITFDEAGARRFFADCDLRAVERELAGNPRVQLFANENDFLLRPEDVEWLRTTLGERAHLFPAGGHLGNLHRDAIQRIIAGIVVETDARSDPPR